MPRQALDSVLSRMAEVQVGSSKSAKGSCRKMAATWGIRCADLHQLSCCEEHRLGGDGEKEGLAIGPKGNWRPQGTEDEKLAEQRLTIKSASIPLCIPVRCFSGSRKLVGKCCLFISAPAACLWVWGVVGKGERTYMKDIISSSS